MAFIDISDAKSQLNMASGVNDADLALYVDAACDEVEQWVGPVSTKVVTGEFVDLMGRTIFNELTTAGTRQFVLRYRPVQSIQAISSAILAGVTYTPSDFVIASTGIVRRLDGGTIFGPLTVDYTAGYVTPPAWARLAAMMIVQHLWLTRRGGAQGPVGQQGQQDSMVPGFGFMIPPQAAELLESHRLVPSVG